MDCKNGECKVKPMPNDVDVGTYSITYGDFSQEKSTTTFNVQSLADNAAFTTAISDFETAASALTDGFRMERRTSLIERLSNAYPSASVATREDKYLISYQDDVTLKIYSVALPTATKDPADFIAGTDFLDLSQADPAALVTAFEALAASPAGNGVTVLSIKYVGRNN